MLPFIKTQCQEIIRTVIPATGALCRLKTKAEVQSHDETIEVYICVAPVKDTSHVLAALRKVPGKATQNLQHLRRVVKEDQLPTWLQEDDSKEPEKAYILLTPTALISESNLKQHLETNSPTYLAIHRHDVPLHAPTSPSHAAAQSRDLWPVAFNPNSSYGPNPGVWSAAERQMGNAGVYIALARQVGTEARRMGSGAAVGVVIVEASDGDEADQAEEKIACVAGDARWTTSTSPCPGPRSDIGNPADHAVMRALRFIAQKRLSQNTKDEGIERSMGCNPLETAFLLAPHSLAPNGYLALNLHVYVSHEPCLMCSMALVHSRVGRVVFGRRMAKTGGLCADIEQEQRGITGEASIGGDRKTRGGDDDAKEVNGLGYGLFWREELNWRFLCWQWKDNDADKAVVEQEMGGATVSEDVHA